ncbi:hypothetical protein DFJ77DRAFT_544126 [Powellomyces hirtus]|nr:hypothetical protein DFJ77DRAFT_544126 [Powellomyces hirtus]
MTPLLTPQPFPQFAHRFQQPLANGKAAKKVRDSLNLVLPPNSQSTKITAGGPNENGLRLHAPPPPLTTGEKTPTLTKQMQPTSPHAVLADLAAPTSTASREADDQPRQKKYSVTTPFARILLRVDLYSSGKGAATPAVASSPAVGASQQGGKLFVTVLARADAGVRDRQRRRLREQLKTEPRTNTQQQQQPPAGGPSGAEKAAQAAAAVGGKMKEGINGFFTRVRNSAAAATASSSRSQEQAEEPSLTTTTTTTTSPPAATATTDPTVYPPPLPRPDLQPQSFAARSLSRMRGKLAASTAAAVSKLSAATSSSSPTPPNPTSHLPAQQQQPQNPTSKPTSATHSPAHQRKSMPTHEVMWARPPSEEDLPSVLKAAEKKEGEREQAAAGLEPQLDELLVKVRGT